MGICFKRTTQYIIGLFIVFSLLSLDIIEIDKNITDPEAIDNYNSKFFNNKNITDGPYIFYENNKIIVKWIMNDRVVKKTISNNNFNIIKRKFGFEFNPNSYKAITSDSINFNQNYKDVKNIIAISDIHGQHDTFVKLLKNYNIIDSKYNWIFGTGHLVIVGDILDRGSKVTESLWLMYKLEQQAKKLGGKVHFLLGNHELMILNNDTRYVNEKYIATAKLMGTTYSQLFTDSTFLGKWLHSKPIIITINDILFVHAGISPDFLNYGFTIEKTNRIFYNQIIGKSWETILPNSSLSFMMRNKGPIWYRGYFESPYITDSQVNSILRYFKTNHIVVGHTSFPNIVPLFNNKIIGIDASIKYGDYGEVLIYKNGELFRGTLCGNIIKL